MIVGFLGMSHLGINYAVASAEKGFDVICYDPNYEKIKNLINNKIDFYEPDLEKLLKKNKKKIFFTNQINLIKKCDLIFLSQDVPTNYKNESNLILIRNLIKETILHLNKKSCFVILSQVHPGFTRQISLNKNRLYYQVETLIFGQALNRIFNAERIIIGSSHLKNKINKYYSFFLKKFKCPIINLTYESAEIAKISINIYLIMQVCTSNLLASVCEKIGADWSGVISTLKLDRRIGNYAYLNPGLGLSGGNLERDLKTLIEVVKKNSIHDTILQSFFLNSKISKDWVLRKIKKLRLNKKKDKIAILGLTYKENTDSIKNSPSIDLIQKLNKYKIFAFDPKANISSLKNINMFRSYSINQTLENAKVLVIMNKWSEFKKISIKKLKKKLLQKNIIDPFGVLKELNLQNKGFNYHVIGN
jgi:UDPglucose 6-dehydrogenase